MAQNIYRQDFKKLTETNADAHLQVRGGKKVIQDSFPLSSKAPGLNKKKKQQRKIFILLYDAP